MEDKRLRELYGKNITNDRSHGKRKKRRKVTSLIGSIFLCVAALMALTLCMITLAKYKSLRTQNTIVMQELESIRNNTEVTYTEAETQAMIDMAVESAKQDEHLKTQNTILDTIRDGLQNGDNFIKVLRQFYPDEIVYVDSGSYYFEPINSNLKLRTHQNDNYIVQEDGVTHYVEDNTIVSKQGIDISKYQEEVDWKAVSEDGIEYAFVRVGVRGYTKGEITLDETFEDNVRGALKNGLDVGVYFFSQAKSEEEAKEEAQAVLDAIEPFKITYPVVIDVEEINSKQGRTNHLTSSERTKYVKVFCDMIRQAGYSPMIYGNLKTFMVMLDMEELESYEKWFAAYDTSVYFPYEYAIWQYTDAGKIDGVAGEVDRNVSFWKPEQ